MDVGFGAADTTDQADIPYQTFAASLLHKFVSGHFVSQR